MSKSIIHHEDLGNTRISLVEEILTDGSKVYNLSLTHLPTYPRNCVVMACTDYDAAVNLMTLIQVNTVEVAFHGIVPPCTAS
jgi:hypothetical protein